MKSISLSKTDILFVPAGSGFISETRFKSRPSNSYNQLKIRKDEKFL